MFLGLLMWKRCRFDGVRGGGMNVKEIRVSTYVIDIFLYSRDD